MDKQYRLTYFSTRIREEISVCYIFNRLSFETLIAHFTKQKTI